MKVLSPRMDVERLFTGLRLYVIAAFFLASILLLGACESKDEDGLIAPSLDGDVSDVWAVETATPVAAETADSSREVVVGDNGWINQSLSPAIAPLVPVVTGRIPQREPTESFTVHELGVEPKIGTVFEKLLARMPDNKTTRGYTRLSDFGGVLDALGLDRLEPGASREERDAYVEYVLSFSHTFNLWSVIHDWPTGQRDYRKIIDTYPDLAFDWMSVDASASSSDFFFGTSSAQSSGIPVSYDVAVGQFVLEKTEQALDGCDCDQPEIREHDGIEYFRWGNGDGTGFIKDRNKRPFYDYIGRGPDLLVRGGEAYYSINDGVIDDHIELINGTLPSLAEVDGYAESAQWMASLGVLSEITFRESGFSVEEVAEINTNREEAVAVDIRALPLLRPFEFAAIGMGFDGEREFTGLVIAHTDSKTAEANVDLMLTRMYEGVAHREAPGRFTPWTEVVDRVDIEVFGEYLVARVFFTQPNGLGSLLVPNTVLVFEGE